MYRSRWTLGIRKHPTSPFLLEVPYLEMMFSVELNGVGAGSCTIDLDAAFLSEEDNYETVLEETNVWEVYRDGVCVHQWEAQSPKMNYIDNTLTRTATISGKGLGESLSHGLVQPPVVDGYEEAGFPYNDGKFYSYNVHGSPTEGINMMPHWLDMFGFVQTRFADDPAGDSAISPVASNLLLNGSFDYWSNGTSKAEFEWPGIYSADNWYCSRRFGTAGFSIVVPEAANSSVLQGKVSTSNPSHFFSFSDSSRSTWAGRDARGYPYPELLLSTDNDGRGSVTFGPRTTLIPYDSFVGYYFKAAGIHGIFYEHESYVLLNTAGPVLNSDGSGGFNPGESNVYRFVNFSGQGVTLHLSETGSPEVHVRPSPAGSPLASVTAPSVILTPGTDYAVGVTVTTDYAEGVPFSTLALWLGEKNSEMVQIGSQVFVPVTWSVTECWVGASASEDYFLAATIAILAKWDNADPTGARRGYYESALSSLDADIKTQIELSEPTNFWVFDNIASEITARDWRGSPYPYLSQTIQGGAGSSIDFEYGDSPGSDPIGSRVLLQPADATAGGYLHRGAISNGSVFEEYEAYIIIQWAGSLSKQTIFQEYGADQAGPIVSVTADGRVIAEVRAEAGYLLGSVISNSSLTPGVEYAVGVTVMSIDESQKSVLSLWVNGEMQGYSEDSSQWAAQSWVLSGIVAGAEVTGLAQDPSSQPTATGFFDGSLADFASWSDVDGTGVRRGYYTSAVEKSDLARNYSYGLRVANKNSEAGGTTEVLQQLTTPNAINATGHACNLSFKIRRSAGFSGEYPNEIGVQVITGTVEGEDIAADGGFTDQSNSLNVFTDLSTTLEEKSFSSIAIGPETRTIAVRFYWGVYWDRASGISNDDYIEIFDVRLNAENAVSQGNSVITLSPFNSYDGYCFLQDELIETRFGTHESYGIVNYSGPVKNGLAEGYDSSVIYEFTDSFTSGVKLEIDSTGHLSAIVRDAFAGDLAKVTSNFVLPQNVDHAIGITVTSEGSTSALTLWVNGTAITSSDSGTGQGELQSTTILPSGTAGYVSYGQADPWNTESPEQGMWDDTSLTGLMRGVWFYDGRLVPFGAVIVSAKITIVGVDLPPGQTTVNPNLVAHAYDASPHTSPEPSWVYGPELMGNIAENQVVEYDIPAEWWGGISSGLVRGFGLADDTTANRLKTVADNPTNGRLVITFMPSAVENTFPSVDWHSKMISVGGGLDRTRFFSGSVSDLAKWSDVDPTGQRRSFYSLDLFPGEPETAKAFRQAQISAAVPDVFFALDGFELPPNAYHVRDFRGTDLPMLVLSWRGELSLDGPSGTPGESNYVINYLETMFTKEIDSAGKPWSSDPAFLKGVGLERGQPPGVSLLDLLNEARAATNTAPADFAIKTEPAKGVRGSAPVPRLYVAQDYGTDLSNEIMFFDRNLAKKIRQIDRSDIRNFVTAQSDLNEISWGDNALGSQSRVQHGRREFYLNTKGEQDQSSLIDSQYQLYEKGVSSWTVSVPDYIEIAGAVFYRPLIDYSVGDWIAVSSEESPSTPAKKVKLRVIAIAGEVSDDGQLRIELTLGTRLELLRERFTALQARQT